MQPLRSRSPFDAVVSALTGSPTPEPEKGGEAPVVLFRTPWTRRDDGWSIAARAYARTMSMGGIDVRLVSHNEMPGEVHSDVLYEVSQFIKPQTKSWDLHLLSTPVNAAKFMNPALSAMALNSGPTALHCVFERLDLEPELVEMLNRLTSIWAQCSANRDVLVAHGVKRVALIHHPYFDDDPHLSIPSPISSSRFYWIGRFEPRKAPDNLLRAFLRAFRPGEAKLTLKLSPYTHNGTYPTPEHVLYDELSELEVIRNRWTAGACRDDIRLIRGSLSRQEMLELHAENDVYCSASRGEGLELGSFAAKLAGRKLCVTDSGGPRDFLGEGDQLVPARGAVEADPSYQWGKGARYASYSVSDLVAAMQAARSTPQTGERVPGEFRAESVAKKFRVWVDELTA